MWHYEIWIHSPLTSVGVFHSTWPSQTTWHMHAPTFNKWHKKKKKTLHILTHDAMWGRALTSLEVCINVIIRDTRERNETIRNEIWTTDIHSLGFQGIREWVIVWKLILRRLGCNWLNLVCDVNDARYESGMIGVLSLLSLGGGGRREESGKKRCQPKYIL